MASEWRECNDERIEALAEAMHVEWLAVMAEQGYHPELNCPSIRGDGCGQCRRGLVPWSEVPEPVKEVNRRGARAMLKAIGCEDGVVPDVRAAVAALRAECGRCEVKSLCHTCSGGEAIYALTGGTDGK